MRCDASSSWFQAPIAGAGAGSTPRSSCSGKRLPLFFFLRKPAISCCSNGSIDSSPISSLSTLSYTRRWYNPLRRRQLDHAPEIFRHWVEADENLGSEVVIVAERFTVASYNILADRNAFWHRDMYVNVPYSYMKWGRRRRVICEELIGWNPDIICLQEVDKYFDLSDALAKAGYKGSYKRRTGDNVDGCAMFWKADKQMPKDTSRKLVIGNIHVLYNPNRGDVKLGQIRFLSSRSQTLSQKWGNAPVILAGDFNSTPQSAIYNFLSSSELNIMSYDRRELSGQKSCHPTQVFGLKQETSSPFRLIDGLLKNCWSDEEVIVATGNSQCHVVAHPLRLNSSYATVRGSSRTREPNGEPLATSYHSKFLGTVDYLWYTDGLLSKRVLDTLSIDNLKRTGGLPCKEVGSDHLALVSEFAFTLDTKE
ncbi:hypothetical protein UlMin_008505 [Ulmus minor]